jgi:hypothetical protein
MIRYEDQPGNHSQCGGAPSLERRVVAERAKVHFPGLVRGEVVPHALPGLGALNSWCTEPSEA